ncbi:hypothetical protein Goshw_004118 [Gossypium schwendimanii]|uniref:Uncharacterized protein n=1 Tax=Gossypium schwendimanii TaxID=34291 RepID=A0A7J9N7R4_GOSSC|nr:hypothetical protein [Gossypium schwendimanii]
MKIEETFTGEIIGAIFIGGDHHNLKPTIGEMPIKVIAEGVESMDGQIWINDKQGKSAKILKNVDTTAYYNLFADQLGNQNRSSVLGSYDEQRTMWNRPNQTALWLNLIYWQPIKRQSQQIYS